jgi:hypothetical protein
MASAVVLTVAALFLAGCSSPTKPAVAQLGSTATPSGSASGSAKGNGLAFSQCMRQHGITNFPDPGSNGGITVNGGIGLDPNNPKFLAASEACKSLLPNGGQPDPAEQAAMQQAALKFSQCMRAHGIADFPDPQFSNGGHGMSIQLPSSIKFNSPQLQAAQKACQALLPKPGGGQTTGGGPSVSVGGGS